MIKAVYVDWHEINLWRNRSFDEKLIDILPRDHSVDELGRICPSVGVSCVEGAASRNVSFVSINECNTSSRVENRPSAPAPALRSTVKVRKHVSDEGRQCARARMGLSTFP